MNLGPLFIVCVGAVVFGCGIVAGLWQWRWVRRALCAEGVVIGLAGGRPGRQALVVAKAEGEIRVGPKSSGRPQVRFTAQGGRNVVFLGRIASRNARYKAGERVRVLYRAESPEQACINRPLELWFLPSMLVFFGALLMAMGCLGWAVSGR